VIAFVNLAIFVAIIVGPLLAFLYGYPLLRRGLNGRPKTAWAIVLVSLLLLLVAAVSFGHLFPNCRVGIGLGTTHCRS
jgi:hypothetical protein